MNRNKKILATAAVFGAMAVAAGAGAFTATSGIDDGAQFVGQTSQTISGVNVTAVSYAIGTGDKTTGVTFSVTEALEATNDVLTVGVGSGGGALVTADSCTPPDGTTHTFTCLWDLTTTAVANVTKLSIVVS
jgi:hypothetical protein